MIRAVIFDWGGVLIENPAPALLAYFSRRLGVSPEELNEAYRKYAEAFQKGKISEEELWRGIVARLDIKEEPSPSLWYEAFREVYTPREEVFSLASELKDRGYRVGLLSNTEEGAVRYFQEQGYEMFDVAVFSCREGTRKPERRIYEIALERLEVFPQEAIFIDDNEEFAKGAKEVGMEAVLYTGTQALKGALSSLLGELVPL
ncbi:MAG: hypothetical protein DRG32_03510 [Deltaproteobacteria bacterium]|nr:MAG: hypothetical protein DRG32_03510 [Deltaproteobacteria bacterium]